MSRLHFEAGGSGRMADAQFGALLAGHGRAELPAPFKEAGGISASHAAK